MFARLMIAVVLAAATVDTATATAGPDPNGVWMRGDGNARVRIAPCGDKICATNLWIRDTSKGEAVGDELVMSVKPESPTELVGEAFDVKRDRTYSMRITVQKDALVTRGCILARLLCNTMTWSRVP